MKGVGFHTLKLYPKVITRKHRISKSRARNADLHSLKEALAAVMEEGSQGAKSIAGRRKLPLASLVRMMV